MSIKQWVNLFDKFAEAKPGELIPMNDVEMREARRYGWANLRDTAFEMGLEGPIEIS